MEMHWFSGEFFSVVSSHLNFWLANIVNEHCEEVLFNGTCIKKTWNEELTSTILCWWGKTDKTSSMKSTKHFLVDDVLEQEVLHASMSYCRFRSEANGICWVPPNTCSSSVVKFWKLWCLLSVRRRLLWNKLGWVSTWSTKVASNPYPTWSTIEDE